MKFRITHKLNDGRAEAPPVEVEIAELDELGMYIVDELQDDNGHVTFPLNAELTIERVA
jgi:hypothetical protein